MHSLINSCSISSATVTYSPDASITCGSLLQGIQSQDVLYVLREMLEVSEEYGIYLPDILEERNPRKRVKKAAEPAVRVKGHSGKSVGSAPGDTRKSVQEVEEIEEESQIEAQLQIPVVAAVPEKRGRGKRGKGKKNKAAAEAGLSEAHPDSPQYR